MDNNESWRKWLAEQRAKSQMSVEEIPLCEVKIWGMQDEGARYGRPDSSFFNLVGVKISVPAGREVKSWDQPLLVETGKGAVVVVKAKGEEKYLLSAKMEPGTSTKPGFIMLAAPLQASESNIKGAHGGKTPPRAELVSGESQIWATIPQDGGRFYGKENIYSFVEVDSNIETGDNERWFTREELREAYWEGDLNEHLLQALAGALL